MDINFGRDGAVRIGRIRVGWIERLDDTPPVRWRLHLTPASGDPGVKGRYDRQGDAKKAAVGILTRIETERSRPADGLPAVLRD